MRSEMVPERVARTINPKTNLGAHTAALACGDFDFTVFLFLLCGPEPFTPPSSPFNPQFRPFPA